MTSPIQKWECGRCAEVHDFEDEAIECCAPSVSEVWECSDCGECFDDEEDALQCCISAEDAAEAKESGFRIFPPPIMETELYIQEYMRLNFLVGAERPDVEMSREIDLT